MAHLFRLLVSLSLAGSVLALVLLALRRILGRRLSGGVLYLAWILVLLRFLLPLPGLVRLPNLFPNEGTMQDAAPVTQVQSDGNTAPIVQSGIVIPETEPATAPLSEPSEGRSTAPALPMGQVLTWLWAVGACGMAGWTLFSYARLLRSLRRTLRPASEQEQRVLDALCPWHAPALYQSDGVGAPLLVGLLRPAILLPGQGCDKEALEPILRHELVHYRRGDLAVKWIAALVCCLHWWNPLAYLVRAELDRACELSCDAWLLRQMDGTAKKRYGELLLSLAAARPLPHRVAAVSLASEKQRLKERLVQIMTYQKRPWTVLLLMAVLVVALTAGAMALGPAKADPVETPAAEAISEQAAPPEAETPVPVEVEASDPVTEPEPDGETVEPEPAPEILEEAAPADMLLLRGFTLSSGISAPFTEADPLTGKPGHNGVDLPVEKGSEVYAAAEGIVTEVGFDAARGYYCTIDHGNGVVTGYCHLMEPCLFEAGDPISAGAVLGYVGATGMATGPHLHFELQIDGFYVDPLPYFEDIS